MVNTRPDLQNLQVRQLRPKLADPELPDQWLCQAGEHRSRRQKTCRFVDAWLPPQANHHPAKPCVSLHPGPSRADYRVRAYLVEDVGKVRSVAEFAIVLHPLCPF